MENPRHELFEELDAANPRWKTQYRSLAHAADSLGVFELYRAYLATPEGREYRARIASAHDHKADNARRLAALNAERSMAAQARRERSATYLEHAQREEPFEQG